MLRTAVILSLCAACDVGALPGHGPDGSTGGDGSSAICEQLNVTPPAGHHNDGMGCMTNSQCHNSALGLGLNAPAYAYGGTLYKDSAGTQKFAGATIFVKLGGTEKKVITADNGNFWITQGAAGLDPPSITMQAQTRASGCPDTASMVGPLQQGGGNCNNCHRNGGTTSPIHLP